MNVVIAVARNRANDETRTRFDDRHSPIELSSLKFSFAREKLETPRKTYGIQTFHFCYTCH